MPKRGETPGATVKLSSHSATGAVAAINMEGEENYVTSASFPAVTSVASIRKIDCASYGSSYGSSDATNAEIATMSSLLSRSPTPFISGAQAPARSPVAIR
jgi:hypothetical protein